MKIQWVVMIAVAAVLLFLFWVDTARPDHIPWMDKYGCCGEKNCLPASVSKKSEAGGVVVNGVPVKIHPDKVHPSETTYGWYCWKAYDRCAPPKGSATVPQALISEECALCAFYEGYAGNF
ncbi:MAG: hypothetical protein AAB533_01245 [Patescibacteria group bacterium]